MMQKKKYGALKFCMLGIMMLAGGILGAGGKNETQAINYYTRIVDAPPAKVITYGQKLSESSFLYGSVYNELTAASPNCRFYWVEPDTIPADGVGTYTYQCYPELNSSLRTDVTVTVVPKSIGACSIAVEESDYTYDGEEKTPAVTVSDGENVLSEGTDYTVGYSDNVNAGTGVITIYGQGNYTSYINRQFTIKGKDITGEITADNIDVIYDGNIHYGSVTAPEGAQVLYGENGDGTSAYSYNLLSCPGYKEAGEYRVYYYVSAENCLPVYGTFFITIREADMEYEISGYEGEYDGMSHSLSVKIPKDAYIMYGTAEGVYSLKTAPVYKNCGEYEIYYRINRDNYSTVYGSETVVISKAQLDYTVENYSGTYDGNSHTGSVSCKEDATVMYGSKQGNYTLKACPTYVNAGSYTVFFRIEKTNYNTEYGSLTIEIQEKDMEYEISGYEGEYDEQPHALHVKKIPKGAVIQYGTEEGKYNLTTCPSYTDSGEYTVYYCITLSNYVTVYASETIRIEDADLLECDIEDVEIEYDGKKHTVKNSYTDGEKVLYSTNGKRYNMTSPPEYSEAGNYTVYYQVSKKNYVTVQGSAALIIKSRDIEKCTAALKVSEYSYTGSEITPDVIVKDGAAVLVHNKDYEVEYSDNIEAGTAYICICGMGNYENEKELAFTIKQKRTENVEIPSIGTVYTYGIELSEIELPDNYEWENDSICPLAGKEEYGAVYIPEDENYAAVSIKIPISVKKAVPEVEQPEPESIIYSKDKILDDILLPSETEGRWVWNNADTVPTVENSGYAATYIPNDERNYERVTATVYLEVEKAVPSYVIPDYLTGTYDEEKTLSDYVLPAGFLWDEPKTVPSAAQGYYTASFTPEDTLNYETAENIEIPVDIEKAMPDVEIPVIRNSVTYDAEQRLEDVYIADGWEWVNGSDVPTTDRKEYKAVYIPSDEENYKKVYEMITLTVLQAVPEEEEPEVDETLIYDAKRRLADISLPVRWTWDNADTVPTVGNSGYTATYIPEDGINYSNLTVKIDVEVEQAVPDVIFPVLPQIKYEDGMKLGDISLADYNTELGQWEWENKDLEITSQREDFEALFVPFDTVNYTEAAGSIEVRLQKAAEGEEIVDSLRVLTVEELPETGIVKYGTKTGSFTLYGGMVVDEDGAEVKGTWEWKEPGSLFSDLGTVYVNAVFVPNDSSYETVEVILEILVKKGVKESVTGVSAADCTVKGGNDGMIVGTTEEMEYKLHAAAENEYKTCMDGNTTGLSAGIYDVRYKAEKYYYASGAIQVEIRDGEKEQPAPSILPVQTEEPSETAVPSYTAEPAAGNPVSGSGTSAIKSVKPVIKKITGKKAGVKVKVKRLADMRYQVQYGIGKKMKKKKTVTKKSAVFTLKKLKRKTTYYIRIRGYRMQDGVPVYTRWSKTKYKKTK